MAELRLLCEIYTKTCMEKGEYRFHKSSHQKIGSDRFWYIHKKRDIIQAEEIHNTTSHTGHNATTLYACMGTN